LIDWTQVLVAGITGLPAIWAAVTAYRAKVGVDAVGKQVGQHVYHVEDRANTESLRAETIQRQVEALVARPAPGPPAPIQETTVGSYVRKAAQAAEAAQAAAESSQKAVEDLKTFVLGHTPTIVMETADVVPLKGPAPPIIPPYKP
jgi:hypothetical protein